MEQDTNKPFIIRLPLPDFLALKKAKEKSFLTAIMSYCDNGKGLCWAGLRDLKDRAGVSLGTASALKRQFIKNGIIQKVGTRKAYGKLVDEIKVNVHLLNKTVQNTVNQSSSPEQKQLKDTYKYIQQGEELKTDNERGINFILDEYAEKITFDKSRSIPILNKTAYKQSVIKNNERPLQEILDLLKKISECEYVKYNSDDRMAIDSACRKSNALEEHLNAYEPELVKATRKWIKENTTNI